MKVYVVSEPDADDYCGSHIHGIFSTGKKAEEYMDRDKPYSNWFVDAYEVDKLIVSTKGEVGVT